MMQLVFALFAEDTNLLPNRVVTKILERASNPERVQDCLSQLFRAMATGGEVILEDVPHFSGGLFDGTDALRLTADEIDILHEAALLDWAEVEPAIFGTLFERSLNPDKRSQLGAHYTSRDDILRIVEPVVLQPLRRRWQEVRGAAEGYLADPPINAKTAAKKRAELVDGPVSAFLRDLHQVRVLDPACGSGNFLYIALQTLKDLEHEVVTFAEQVGAPGFRLVGPRQFHGIEVNPFARELASTVVWIGYLQWNRANGFSNAQKPVLEPLGNIRLHDALMNDDGTEYEWPEAEFIIGNPPFLGGQRMRAELGDDYVEALRALFDGRLPGNSDFVCYWFERARAEIESKRAERAGLIATNGIRGPGNRTVLERIASTGRIFTAWSDEPWILDGAAVRVSIVAFDGGSEDHRLLNGRPVAAVHADLTSGVDLSPVRLIQENHGRAFTGPVKVGPFEIDGDVARAWIALPNASGHANSDVLRPWVNGMDLVRKPRGMYIVDFGRLTEAEARRYEMPFAYVGETVRPLREQNRDSLRRNHWWRLGSSGQNLREAIAGLGRFICTPRVAAHRLFVWVDGATLPDIAVVAIAADDDYTFGVLHSRLHESWSLALGTSHGVGNTPRYTLTTCFETFPFPEVQAAHCRAVATAAAHLNSLRNHLLSQDSKMTLTKLYNEMTELRERRDPTARTFPLLLAHEALDKTVADAYGWEWPITDDEILRRLLELNLARVSNGAAVRVSIVAFDDGRENELTLDGRNVSRITAGLTSGPDVRRARPLRANSGKSFVGIQKGGAFDIDESTALAWMGLPNPDGANNSDVLKRFFGGNDIVDQDARRWIIDFATRDVVEAKRYTVPFAHVQSEVKPSRDTARRVAHRTRWWRHHDTRPAFRTSVANMARYIATPFTSKHRIFVWKTTDLLPSNAAIAIAADDDFTFGVLHSRLHEVWSLATGSSLGVSPRYTPATCFETFPFPLPSEATKDAISAAAAHLDTVRRYLVEQDARLTLTKLYNQLVELREHRDPTARAFPLLLAHEALDKTVADAYGWEWPITDDEILRRLLKLNLTYRVTSS